MSTLSSTLQELRAHITGLGLESPSPNHASISAYIETNIINNPNSLFKRRVPPLDIVLYAIRRLFEPPPDAPPDTPRPRLRDVPDLLDFVTTIEFYRKLTLQRAEEALTIHEYYLQTDDRRANLTKQDVKRLKDYKANGDNLRKMYIEIVSQFCLWHIHYLWTSSPPRPADVTLHLCEYFPNLNEYYRNSGKKSPRLFHSDLTDAESRLLDERGKESCEFVVTSCEWAESRLQFFPGQTIANMIQTPEFSEQFPCNIDLSSLRSAMDFFLKAVDGMVNELQEMFPSGEYGS
ncbi:hypothetical protein C8R45DRAFT_1045488 [Mycena sanguinolenta]|nr:hypothetical protein C8R45DRAFT_1045488 [Mycena sanguinolenta]